MLWRGGGRGGGRGCNPELNKDNRYPDSPLPFENPGSSPVLAKRMGQSIFDSIKIEKAEGVGI